MEGLHQMVLVLLAALVMLPDSSFSLKAGDCEVCVGVITKLVDGLPKGDLASPDKLEQAFRTFCKTSTKSENRFCYYVGGLEESATSIITDLTKPLSWGLPPLKVCEKLKKMDQQICELHYPKTIDLKNVDLKKLKVRDLKKILSDWEERCDGCLEKGDFIRRIEELKPKYMKTEL